MVCDLSLVIINIISINIIFRQNYSGISFYINLIASNISMEGITW